MAFFKRCKYDHDLPFAGVDSKYTWACPDCHVVFEITKKQYKQIEKIKNGKHKDRTVIIPS